MAPRPSSPTPVPQTPPPRPRPPAHLVTTTLVAKPDPHLVVKVRHPHELAGLASWYCNADRRRGPTSPCMVGYPDRMGLIDRFAAAGPRLRAAICGVQSCTSWRGKIVSVDGQLVKLVDWCQCYRGKSNEKLIDLYRDVFGLTGSGVTIRW